MRKTIAATLSLFLLCLLAGGVLAQDSSGEPEGELGFDPFAEDVVVDPTAKSSSDFDPFAEDGGVLNIEAKPASLSVQEQLNILVSKFEAGQYSKKGADDCMRCHKKTEGVADIFYTSHGRQEHPKSPMAGLQCEACHGPQGKHSGEDEPMLSFSKHSALTSDMKNSVCISCHEGEHRENWVASIHNMEDTACVDCHTVHVSKDPILTVKNQANVCLDCHTDKKADIHKRSSHPIATLQLTCTDCHSPHGSFGPSALKQMSVNENCYECHAEKRGPKLWEHAPVVEDCSNCHTAHGSVNDNLLKARPPMLCKECHSESGHPSTVPGTNSTIQFAGQSCMNCHTRIHGSNHPNGKTLRY